MRREKKNFEDALTELEEIVEKLENGELSLEDSLQFFKKGVELSQYCSMKLDEVEKQIKILLENEKGEVKEEVFEADKILEA